MKGHPLKLTVPPGCFACKLADPHFTVTDDYRMLVSCSKLHLHRVPERFSCSFCEQTVVLSLSEAQHLMEMESSLDDSLSLLNNLYKKAQLTGMNHDRLVLTARAKFAA